jgi:hypothetical protein
VIASTPLAIGHPRPPMRVHPAVLGVLVMTACCPAVQARPPQDVHPSASRVDPLAFRSVLDGSWDEGPAHEIRSFCGPGRNLHRHLFSADGKRVTWDLDSPEKIYDGTTVRSSTYRVVAASSVSLTLALEGEKRLDASGKPLVWELVIVDDGLFRWRATGFPVGSYNIVWGRRCKPDKEAPDTTGTGSDQSSGLIEG